MMIRKRVSAASVARCVTRCRGRALCLTRSTIYWMYLNKKYDVLVVGGGLIGISTAICLQEANLKVLVVADKEVVDTTSVVAGAIWWPFLAEPADKVQLWSRNTFKRLVQMYKTDPKSMISMVPSIEYSEEDRELPTWYSALPVNTPIRRLSSAELPSPSDYKSGWECTLPIAEMPDYMHVLNKIFLANGGEIRLGVRVDDLSTLRREVDSNVFIINCVGLNARAIDGDTEMVPIRGQTVVVRDEHGIVKRTVADAGSPPTYVLVRPLRRDIVCGGTAYRFDENLEPDENDTREILKRCTRLEPKLAGLPVVRTKVGLRPGRSAIRLEVDATRRRVVHNYGHGGSGFTVSWGCAEEVVQLVRGQRAAL